MTILDQIENHDPSAVFFNFDGLLSSVESLKYNALKNALAKNIGLEAMQIDQKELKLFANSLENKNTFKKEVESFLKNVNINKTLPTNFRRIFFEELEDLKNKFDNIYLLLFIHKKIKSKKIALLSNIEDSTARKSFKNSSISGVFKNKLFITQEASLNSKIYQDFIDDKNTLENEKDAPMALAMYKLGVNPEETIILVDNLNALKISLKLGLNPIAYIGLIVDEVEKSKINESMLKLIPSSKIIY